MHLQEDEVGRYVESVITELTRQQVIKSESDALKINRPHVRTLQLHSAGVREILQRYYIGLSVLSEHPEISRNNLEKESRLIAQRLSILHGINAPEFFDKAIFSTFSTSLKMQGYFDEQGNSVAEKVKEAEEILRSLISVEIQLTIQGAMENAEEGLEKPAENTDK